MDAVELAYAGIARQAELIASGEISSRELVELYLDRIARAQARLNAFRVVLGERVLMEADQADARRGAGGERPLLGVPIAVKDDIDVAGELTAFGTNARENPAQADAEVVRRLRAAGALIIGKTNVPELCMFPFTETATYGVTRNPWNLQRTPGGSSGGSASAVAAGLVGGALGSDGAGSIRIPAAWCGLVGLKPQRGRVPLAPRPRAWRGLSVNGVLTRRVADTALFQDIASGPSDVDLDSAPAPAVPFAQAAATAPGRLRIALSSHIPPGTLARLSSEGETALRETAELLRSLGHIVSEEDPDFGLGAGPTLIAHYVGGISDDAQGIEHPERLERRTRGMARLGTMVAPPLFARARSAAEQLQLRLGRLFERHDVLLTAPTAVPAPSIGALQGRGALATLNAVAGWCPYTGPWNLTGQPAVAVPAGLGTDGMPRSVQLVGRANDEGTLLSLASQLEAERGWAEQRPPEHA